MDDDGIISMAPKIFGSVIDLLFGVEVILSLIRSTEIDFINLTQFDAI